MNPAGNPRTANYPAMAVQNRPSSPPTSPNGPFTSSTARSVADALPLNARRRAGIFKLSHSPLSDDPDSLPRHIPLWGSTPDLRSLHRNPPSMSSSGSEAEEEAEDESDSEVEMSDDESEDESEDESDAESDEESEDESEDEDLEIMEDDEKPLPLRAASPEVDECLSDASSNPSASAGSSRRSSFHIEYMTDDNQQSSTLIIEELNENDPFTAVTDAEVLRPDTVSDAETDPNSALQERARKQRENREFCSDFSRLKCCTEDRSDDDCISSDEAAELMRRRRERHKRWSQRSSYQKRSYTESVGSSGSDGASCEIDRDMIDGQGINVSERRLRRRIRGPADASRFSLNSVGEEVLSFLKQGVILAEVDEPEEWVLDNGYPPGYIQVEGLEGLTDPMDRAWQELPFWLVSEPMAVDELEYSASLGI